jgi:ribosomal protein S18 acetylase RimI-like enzyme
MNEKSLENINPSQEKLNVKIEIARPEDWEAYKKLRLLAVTGQDTDMFGVTPEEAEQEKTRSDREWQVDLSRDDMYILFSTKGSEAIGMARIKKTGEDNVWSISSIYVKPESRGGVGRKLYAASLSEIKKRGGIKVEVGINVVNSKSIGLAESFGFKNVMFSDSKGRKWNELDLDLTNPEVIKKISDVLNAG